VSWAQLFIMLRDADWSNSDIAEAYGFSERAVRELIGR
jgi:hypothetical protein